MAGTLVALVVSDLYPYTADLREDLVYAVIEFETALDHPHRALVGINGIRKGDRVKVAVQQSGMITTYRIVGKVDPPTPDSGKSARQPVPRRGDGGVSTTRHLPLL